MAKVMVMAMDMGMAMAMALLAMGPVPRAWANCKQGPMHVFYSGDIAITSVAIDVGPQKRSII